VLRSEVGATQAAACEEERVCAGDVDLSVDDSGLCTVIDGSVTVSGALRYPMPCVHSVTLDVQVSHNTLLTNLTGMHVRHPPRPPSPWQQ